MIRVKLNCDKADTQWTTPMDTHWFRDTVLEHGILIVDEQPDVTIQDWHNGPPTESNTIIFDRVDTAAITTSATEWDDDPRVIGYITPILADGPCCMSEWYKTAGVTAKPVVPLTVMLWDQLRNTWLLDEFTVNKDFDVSFCGMLTYGKKCSYFPRNHRGDLASQWRQLDNHASVSVFGTFPRLLSWREAYEVTKRSKVVVSPWGICELSWRDYEATLARAMIVKPRQSKIRVTESPWQDDNTVYCEPDFSDLRPAVDEAMERYNEANLYAIRKRMVEQGRNLHHFCNHFKEAIEACLSPNISN